MALPYALCSSDFIVDWPLQCPLINMQFMFAWQECPANENNSDNILSNFNYNLNRKSNWDESKLLCTLI